MKLNFDLIEGKSAINVYITYITAFIFLHLLFVILLIDFMDAIPIFAHNNYTLAIPVSKSPVSIDGETNEKAWNDAFVYNITHAGNSTIRERSYLISMLYELADNSLTGAFIIPDSTISTSKNNPDQVSFLWDVSHSAYNNTTPDSHDLVFLRDGSAEYYKGNAKTDSYDNIRNSTAGQNEIQLENPFLKSDYHIKSDANSWRAEFKIYFSGNPTTYGFAIQRSDSFPDNQSARQFLNFPLNTTDAFIPSSWGDISFFNLNEYISNIELFCPENQAYSPNKNNVLCITSVFPRETEAQTGADIVVNGNYADLLNGTGIRGHKVRANIINMNGQVVKPPEQGTPDDTTDKQGHFDYNLKSVNLPTGEYLIKAELTDGSDEGLNATTRFAVNPHTLTIGELNTYIGIIATIVGLVAGIPTLRAYYRRKRQRENLCSYMLEIEDIYRHRTYTKQHRLHLLSEKKNFILQKLKEGRISEEHYGMLDKEFSDYEAELNKG
jgi:hypothetical protein